MQRNIAKINLINELDVVLAYKRAVQLSERCGLMAANPTKFATAVSEICRNVIEYVGEGCIEFSIAAEKNALYLEALVTDCGKGITDLPRHLESKNVFPQRGVGLANSKKLVDDFKVITDGGGTHVRLRKIIPAVHPNLSEEILDKWARDFENETSVSPYLEIKKQNTQLLELLEQLRVKNLETETQLQEIQRLNQELYSSNEEIITLLQENEANNILLEKKNRELDAFAHIVSHDLRAPLQNIKGLIMVMETYLQNQDIEAALPVLKMVGQQAGRMDNLILDILSYSLAGKKTLAKKTVNVQNLLYEVISFLNIPDGLKIHIPEELPVLQTEEVFLRQIFSNLVNNAIKHHDKPTGMVELSFRKRKDLLEFAVTDDGPGIPAADQERIFNQFETANNASLSASTGLGLTIIKKITKEKGGDVWVESSGRGSRFVFTWPAAELVPVEKKKPSKAHKK